MAAEEKKDDSKLPSVDDVLKSAPGVPPSLGIKPQAEDDDIIDFNPDDIDKILAEEDPKFAAELKEIQASEFKTNVAIEAVDIEAFLKEGEAIKAKQAAIKKLGFKERAKIGYETSHARTSKIIDDFQNGSLNLIKTIFHFFIHVGKKLFKYSLGAIGHFFSWLLHLPRKTKLLSLAVLILGAASIFSICMSFKGHFLPQMQGEYLTGFADHADESFEYKQTDSKETFESEIRHPEHMYEIEKVVVNLKAGPNPDHLPMGLFEFYVELNSQDATVELGDRKTEARHVIERVLEQLTYEELITPKGKSKLKFIVRKELNEFLSKSHHVRQVYIKSFVLKP